LPAAGCTNIGLVFIVSVFGDTCHFAEMTPCDTITMSKETAYFKAQEANIQDVLEMFVLPKGCLQALLELKMSNPYLLATYIYVDYGHACCYCQ
jgi:hypothetical protein